VLLFAMVDLAILEIPRRKYLSNFSLQIVTDASFYSVTLFGWQVFYLRWVFRIQKELQEL
jgi:hypothetical protein